MAVVLAALLVLLGVRVGDCCDTWVPAASADALMLTPQALATAAAHCEPVDESSIDCCISAGDHRTELATDRTRAGAPSLTHAVDAQPSAAAHGPVGPLGPPAPPPLPGTTGGRDTLIGICVSRT